MVLVWLYQCTSTFFGGIVGVHHICESVRSVGSSTYLTQTTTTPQQVSSNISISTNIAGPTSSTTVFPPTTSYQTSTITTPVANGGSLFALSSACGKFSAGGAIEISSNNATINGSVYSNGGVYTDNSGYIFNKSVTYNGACTGGNAPTGTFNGGAPSPTGGGASYPYLPTSAQLAAICNAPGAVNLPTTAITVPNPIPAENSGVYCSNVSITDSQNASQNVTFIAPNILINGNKKQDVNPAVNGPDGKGLLVYVLGPGYASPYDLSTPALTPPASAPFSLSANGAADSGDILAPATTVTVDGVAEQTGYIEAQRILVNTNGTSVGDGPTPGGPTTSQTITTGTTIFPASSTVATTPGSTSYNTVTNYSTISGSTVTSTTGTNEGLAG